MNSPKFIWVTRSAPDNLVSSHHLRATGHNPLIAPVLAIRPLVHPTELHPPDALIFTSCHGVRHHHFDGRFTNVPVFAIGQRTAMTAVDAGYRTVHSADGNVSELQALMHARLAPGAEIIHFSAAEPASDLPRALNDRGLSVRQITVYESDETPLENLGPALAALPWIDGILVHSPKAGARIAGFVADCGTYWRGKIFCISEASAAPLRQVTRQPIIVARAPNERALLTLIDRDPGQWATI
ncbi:MAG: uroporphyrinogen-III synthase [Pseudomonadota bacterium]